MIGSEGLKRALGCVLFHVHAKQTVRALICGRLNWPGPAIVDTHFSDAKGFRDVDGIFVGCLVRSGPTELAWAARWT